MRVLMVLVLLISSDAVLAQTQKTVCRQELNEYVCRVNYQVVSRCRMELNEYVCRDSGYRVIQKCRKGIGDTTECTDH